jgi:hypothetical protein
MSDEYNILIGKDGSGQYSVLSMSSSYNVLIKNYDQEDKFLDKEVFIVNRPRSNTVLVAVKSNIAHLIAKDPNVNVAINNNGELKIFSNNKVVNTPVRSEEAKKPVEAINPKIVEAPAKIEEDIVVKEPAPKKVKLDIKPKEIIEESEDTRSTSEKIAIIKKKISYVIKSEIKHAFLICGGSGLGKSFLVEDVLENQFDMRRDIHFIVYKGSMTETGLFTVLTKNPSKIIILDDCDSVWKDDNALNLLKGALDSTVPKKNKKGYVYEVEYYIQDDEADTPEESDVKEYFTTRIDNAVSEQECINIFNKKISQLEEAEDLHYVIKTITKVNSEFIKPRRYISKVSKGKGKDFPVEFRGKLMFVSNLPLKSFNDAVKTRMTTSELNLDRDQTIEYVSEIAGHIMPHIKDMEFKKTILEFYRKNNKLEFNLREFANAIDLALTEPDHWQELIYDFH